MSTHDGCASSGVVIFSVYEMVIEVKVKLKVERWMTIEAEKSASYIALEAVR